MTERVYRDFDLLVQPGRDGGYQARVLNGPLGETPPVPIMMPFTDLDLENFFLRIGRPRRMPARGGQQSPEAQAIRDFGSRLYDAVFHDELRVALGASLDQAEGSGAGLRVRLRLTDCPELADLPWEYLYYKDAHRFLALSEWTPLVRYLDLHSRARPLAVQPPVRILVMVSSPTDFQELDVEAEWDKLREALRDLEDAGRVEVHRVPDGSLGRLQRQLRKAEYHVFHYIGHGAFESHGGNGMLALEGPLGRGELVSGDDLGTLLHDHRTLRLAVLNSCEGARAGRTDPYAGTAQSLVRNGIPAVVAMQFEITDEAAIVFARSLYEAVADGYPLDASVAEARKAVRHHANPVEWGTPVLYMRSPDGRIFDIDAAPSQNKAWFSLPDGESGGAAGPVQRPPAAKSIGVPTEQSRASAANKRGPVIGALTGLLAVGLLCAALLFFPRGSTATQPTQPTNSVTTVTFSASPSNAANTPSPTPAPATPAPTQAEAVAVVDSYFLRFSSKSLTPADMAALFMPTVQWYGKALTRTELHTLLSEIDVAKHNETFELPVLHRFTGGAAYGGQPSSKIDYRVNYHKASGSGAVIVSYILVKGVDGLSRIAAISETAA